MSCPTCQKSLGQLPDNGISGQIFYCSNCGTLIEDDRVTVPDAQNKIVSLIDTIKSHDIESLSCDRDGELYCDCLKNAISRFNN